MQRATVAGFSNQWRRNLTASPASACQRCMKSGQPFRPARPGILLPSTSCDARHSSACSKLGRKQHTTKGDDRLHETARLSMATMTTTAPPPPPTTTTTTTNAPQARTQAILANGGVALRQRFKETDAALRGCFGDEAFRMPAGFGTLIGWRTTGDLARTATRICDTLYKLIAEKRSEWQSRRPKGQNSFQDPFYALECFLLGVAKSHASPHITIICEVEWLSKSLKDIIVGSKLLRAHPGWRCFRLPFRLSTTASSDAGGDETFDRFEVYSYRNGPAESFNGLPVQICDGSKLVGRTSIGGLVTIDGVLYGLTVGHAFRSSKPPPPPPQSFQIDESELGFLDDSDDSAETTSTTSLEVSTASSSYTDTFVPNEDVSGVDQSQLDLRRGHFIGHVWCVSGAPGARSRDNGLDWALISIDWSTHRKELSRRNKMDTSRVGVPVRGSGQEIKLVAPSATHEGFVLSNGVFSIPNYAAQPALVAKVEYTKPGDSGSWAWWVSSGKPLGMLIGSCAPLQEVYLLSMDDILVDIRRQTGSIAKLDVNETQTELHQRIRDDLDACRRVVFREAAAAVTARTPTSTPAATSLPLPTGGVGVAPRPSTDSRDRSTPAKPKSPTITPARPSWHPISGGRPRVPVIAYMEDADEDGDTIVGTQKSAVVSKLCSRCGQAGHTLVNCPQMLPGGKTGNRRADSQETIKSDIHPKTETRDTKVFEMSGAIGVPTTKSLKSKSSKGKRANQETSTDVESSSQVSDKVRKKAESERDKRKKEDEREKERLRERFAGPPSRPPTTRRVTYYETGGPQVTTEVSSTRPRRTSAARPISYYGAAYPMYDPLRGPIYPQDYYAQPPRPIAAASRPSYSSGLGEVDRPGTMLRRRTSFDESMSTGRRIAGAPSQHTLLTAGGDRPQFDSVDDWMTYDGRRDPVDSARTRPNSFFTLFGEDRTTMPPPPAPWPRDQDLAKQRRPVAYQEQVQLEPGPLVPLTAEVLRRSASRRGRHGEDASASSDRGSKSGWTADTKSTSMSSVEAGGGRPMKLVYGDREYDLEDGAEIVIKSGGEVVRIDAKGRPAGALAPRTRPSIPPASKAVEAGASFRPPPPPPHFMPPTPESP
jgi:hypothetical protein